MARGLGLYPTPNHLGRAQSFYGQAAGSYGSMMKKRPEPEKTAGGALQSGASGAMAGASIGALTAETGATGLAAVGGPWTLAAGTALGVGSYLLS